VKNNPLLLGSGLVAVEWLSPRNVAPPPEPSEGLLGDRPLGGGDRRENSIALRRVAPVDAAILSATVPKFSRDPLCHRRGMLKISNQEREAQAPEHERSTTPCRLYLTVRGRVRCDKYTSLELA